jgi:hypothetical protein
MRLISIGILCLACPPGGPPTLHPAGSVNLVIFFILPDFASGSIKALRFRRRDPDADRSGRRQSLPKKNK